MNATLWKHAQKPIAQRLATLGHSIGLVGELFGYILRGNIRWGETLYQVARLGVSSLPMVVALNVIIGAVLSLQLAQRFAANGAEAYVGGIVALAIVREIGPIFAAMAVGARAGTAMASELANMTVRQQLDALQMLHIHPVRYLAVPRFLACLISLPLLTLVSELVSIISGMFVVQWITQLNPALFIESIWLMLRPFDIWVSLIKAFIFGGLLAITCIRLGTTASGGAQQIGQSATRSAVWTAVWVVFADFFLSWLFFASQLFN